MTHVHFIGIGGTGLSAIATLLLERGLAVSGSDAQASATTDRLRQRGAAVFIGHRAENVDGADLVVVSSAVPADNPEMVAAHARGLPVKKRAEFMGELMEGRIGVCVAGTHGKTTTTALIAYMLMRADRDPSFIVGGMLADLGTNGRHGGGLEFVVEADEYDRMFLGLRPNVAVVTSVEHDHPDYYATAAEYLAAFEEFVDLVPGDGIVVVCADDEGAQAIGAIAERKGKRVVWYGLNNAAARWKAEHVQSNGLGGSDFVVTRNGETVGLARSRLPGVHNVSNSVAAFAAVDWLGVDFNAARTALSEFQGVGRRFEIKGEVNGITVIDDYAHHPTEIRATLAATKRRYGDREVWAMFQPHTFSRTRTLLADFAASFGDADHVLVTDIYHSREAFDETISARQIVEQMQKEVRHPDVRYVPTLPEAVKTLLTEVKSGDVLITLGAGDGNTVGESVLEALRR